MPNIVDIVAVHQLNAVAGRHCYFGPSYFGPNPADTRSKWPVGKAKGFFREWACSRSGSGGNESALACRRRLPSAIFCQLDRRAEPPRLVLASGANRRGRLEEVWIILGTFSIPYDLVFISIGPPPDLVIPMEWNAMCQWIEASLEWFRLWIDSRGGSHRKYHRMVLYCTSVRHWFTDDHPSVD
jgi:hypothetical protein